MSDHITQLPMYDWPEVRAATDALWAEIHTALQKRDIASPNTLNREEATETAWLSTRLLLSQTCGLPLVQDLRDQVADRKIIPAHSHMCDLKWNRHAFTGTELYGKNRSVSTVKKYSWR